MLNFGSFYFISLPQNIDQIFFENVQKINFIELSIPPKTFNRTKIFSINFQFSEAVSGIMIFHSTEIDALVVKLHEILLVAIHNGFEIFHHVADWNQTPVFQGQDFHVDMLQNFLGILVEVSPFPELGWNETFGYISQRNSETGQIKPKALLLSAGYRVLNASQVVFHVDYGENFVIFHADAFVVNDINEPRDLRLGFLQKRKDD